jgi:hypothetical protein
MKWVSAFARPLVPPLALLALHEIALRALAAKDVVGQILGAAEAPAPALVALMVAFYLVRLVAIFVAPGWLLLALACGAISWRRRRG